MADGGREASWTAATCRSLKVPSSSARRGNRKLAANLAGKVFSTLNVARHRFDDIRCGIYPEGVFAAFAFEAAAVGLQVLKQVAPFHQTRTEVCSAPWVRFRDPARACSPPRVRWRRRGFGDRPRGS